MVNIVEICAWNVKPTMTWMKVRKTGSSVKVASTGTTSRVLESLMQIWTQ